MAVTLWRELYNPYDNHPDHADVRVFGTGDALEGVLPFLRSWYNKVFFKVSVRPGKGAGYFLQDNQRTDFGIQMIHPGKSYEGEEGFKRSEPGGSGEYPQENV